MCEVLTVLSQTQPVWFLRLTHSKMNQLYCWPCWTTKQPCRIVTSLLIIYQVCTAQSCFLVWDQMFSFGICEKQTRICSQAENIFVSVHFLWNTIKMLLFYWEDLKSFFHSFLNIEARILEIKKLEFEVNHRGLHLSSFSTEAAVTSCGFHDVITVCS